MVREVMWSAWDGPGLGHLRLSVRDSGVVADGLVLGVADGRPLSDFPAPVGITASRSSPAITASTTSACPGRKSS